MEKVGRIATLAILVGVGSACGHQAEEFVATQDNCIALSPAEETEKHNKVLDYFHREVGTDVQRVKVEPGRRCALVVEFWISAYVTRMDSTLEWKVEEASDGTVRLVRPE